MPEQSKVELLKTGKMQEDQKSGIKAGEGDVDVALTFRLQGRRSQRRREIEYRDQTVKGGGQTLF